MQRTKSNDEIKETFQNEKYLVEKPNILKNNYTVPTKKNPLMNIMMDDYKYNKDKKPAAPSYNENILKQINETAKNPNSELYKNLGDNLKYENSMQNFYTMPNTKIPNDQEAFAKFCYGGMKSCKEGDSFQCARNNLAGRRGVS
jgi:site-specific DNA-cytosine methylase